MTNYERLQEIERLVEAGRFKEAWSVRQEFIGADFANCGEEIIQGLVMLRRYSMEFDRTCRELDRMVYRLLS